MRPGPWSLTEKTTSSPLVEADTARVTAEAFASLWLAVARELDDEFFGLDRRRMKVGSFALLSHAALGSGNLDRAIKRILRGFSTFLDDVAGDLSLDGEHAVISVANRIEMPSARRFADETYLVMVHGLMCWLSGRRIPLVSAEFAYPRPIYGQEYIVMYSPQLVFDAERTAVRFDAPLLSAPVVQNAATLRTFLRTAPQSVFLRYRNEDGWAAKVRRKLRPCLGGGDWPVLEDVARAFHVAPTTLRRRLEGEGSSYQTVKDELRRDAAIHHLCRSTLSVGEISAELGFLDPSAFHRAFKKWSGMQPGEYRALQSQGRRK